MRKITLLLGFLIASYCSYAQEYFQQEVNYNIQVRLDDEQHKLSARIDLEYKNNAPHALNEIWFHLWPNAYSNLNTAFARQAREIGSLDFQFSKAADKGRIDSLNFTVDGKPVSWTYDTSNCDICKIVLNEPILPGTVIRISTPFSVKIPSASFSRFGHSGQSYFISQWYPKPVVYDKDGWHPIPYLNQGEFFSEFGTFDVFITLPQNYTVAATGNLTGCPEEQIRLDSLAQRTARIKNFYSEDTLDYRSSREMKTLHFHQEKVHDFAWFADKHYHVLQGEVDLPKSHRKVKTAVYFTDVEATLWKDAVAYLNNGIYYYSLWVGEYPYDRATAVQGVLSAGAGMEYPTITIIGRSGTARLLEDVIVHEVGHNWFYGIIGSNERQHPFLDESINSYYEDRYMEMKYPWRGNNITFKTMWDEFSGTSGTLKYLSWSYFAGLGLDLSSTLPATAYPATQYGTDVYFKGSFAMTYLEKAVGRARFDTAMQSYYRGWQFRHPGPADFRAVMQKSLKDSLNWFFDQVIAQPGGVDYKLRSLHKKQGNSDSLVLTLINKGNSNGPFPISGLREKKVDTTFWFPGFKGETEIVFPKSDFQTVQIDPAGYLPEAFRRNNILYTKGLWHGRKPLGLKFFYRPPDPRRNNIFLLPAVGRNQYDQFMLGFVALNDPFFSKHWEWAVVPLYAIGTAQLNGMARLAYVVHPLFGLLKEARISLGYKRFSFQGGDDQRTSSKLTPSLDLELRSDDPLSPFRTIISFRRPHLRIEGKTLGKGTDASDLWMDDYYMNELSYLLKNIRQMHPWSLRFAFQQNPEFSRIFAEGKLRWLYADNGKAIHLRLFAGHYITSNVWSFSNPGFHLRGIRGIDDPYFDGIFPGRTDTKGLYSQQFIEEEGGLIGLGDAEVVYDNLASLSLKLDFPFMLPLRFFFDAGTTFTSNVPVVLGLSVPLAKNDIFEVFFPLYYSELKASEGKMFDHYGEKIRFTLNLQKLDLLKMAKKLTP